eukprot:PhM_4_TR2979/c0_g1_i1/m.3933
MTRKDTVEAYAATSGFPKPKRTPFDGSYTRMESKDVIAAEHKVEVCDSIQDCITSLKSLYRTKFIFGEQLKFVDANHASDAFGQFNVPVPASFDVNLSRPQQQMGNTSVAGGGGGGGGNSSSIS